MSEEQPLTGHQWLVERLDRFDDKLDRRMDSMHTELVTTRHAQKASLETMALQLATTTANTLENTRRIERAEPKIDSENAWRNRMTGALALMAFLFPTTIAAVVAVSVKL